MVQQLRVVALALFLMGVACAGMAFVTRDSVEWVKCDEVSPCVYGESQVFGVCAWVWVRVAGLALPVAASLGLRSALLARRG